jgi:hypothetical protein
LAIGLLSGVNGRADYIEILRSACQAGPVLKCLHAIKTAGRLEKDFVSWAHACETWACGTWEIVSSGISATSSPWLMQAV